MNDSMFPIIQTFLSNFVSAYRKHCSTKDVLIRLVENWKNLDNNKILGAAFMGLFKAFGCIT